MDMEEEFERLVDAIRSDDYVDATRDDILASVGRNNELLRMKVMFFVWMMIY